MDHENIGSNNKEAVSKIFIIISIITFCVGGLFALLSIFSITFTGCKPGMQCTVIEPLANVILLTSLILLISYIVLSFKIIYGRKIFVAIYIVYVIGCIFLAGISFFAEQRSLLSCEIDRTIFGAYGCYEYHAFARRDPQYCYGRESCLYSLYELTINQQQDVSFCEKWDDPDCFSYFAIKDDNPKLCLESDEMINCLNAIAGRVSDPNICNYYPDKNDSSYMYCVEDYAEQNNDLSMCYDTHQFAEDGFCSNENIAQYDIANKIFVENVSIPKTVISSGNEEEVMRLKFTPVGGNSNIYFLNLKDLALDVNSKNRISNIKLSVDDGELFETKFEYGYGQYILLQFPQYIHIKSGGSVVRIFAVVQKTEASFIQMQFLGTGFISKEDLSIEQMWERNVGVGITGPRIDIK